MNPYEILFDAWVNEARECLPEERALDKYLEKKNLPYDEQAKIDELIGNSAFAQRQEAFYAGIDIAKRFLMK